MSTEPPRESLPPDPPAPSTPAPDPAALRQRLATLLGRLLARHWLRSRQPPAGAAEPGESPPPGE